MPAKEKRERKQEKEGEPSKHEALLLPMKGEQGGSRTG